MEKINPVYLNINYNKSELPAKQTEISNKGTSQTDLSVLNNYKRDLVIPFKNNKSEIETENFLDNFVLNPKMKLSYTHGLYYYKNQYTKPVLRHLVNSQNSWARSPLKLKEIIPWKLHIYADNEADWGRLAATVGSYLNTQPAEWKTLSANTPIEALNKSKTQKGKAFTIYTSSQEQFKQIAHDIDYIIRKSGLEKADTSIIGDRQLGDTGRIFYRYDHKTGATKDTAFHINDYKEMAEFLSEYEPNRGDDKYLAEDMTSEDDPFYYYNPQNDF